MIELVLFLEFLPVLVYGNVIKIGAVLPANPQMLFSISKVNISASMAIRSLSERRLLRKHNITIGYRDSKCDEALGMKEAIDSVVNDKVHVLFGPVCDYAAAPVARQVTFWNMPMVSVGAVANDFIKRRDTVYPLLTRAGPANFDMLAHSLYEQMRKYNWTKFKLIYEKHGHNDILPVFCHLVGDSIVTTVPPDIHLDYHRFIPTKDYNLYEEMLKTELGMSYAGKL